MSILCILVSEDPLDSDYFADYDSCLFLFTGTMFTVPSSGLLCWLPIILCATEQALAFPFSQGKWLTVLVLIGHVLYLDSLVWFWHLYRGLSTDMVVSCGRKVGI
jgi:hypothetical protein